MRCCRRGIGGSRGGAAACGCDGAAGRGAGGDGGVCGGAAKPAKEPLLWVIRRRLSFMYEEMTKPAEEEEESEEAPVRAEVPERPLVFAGLRGRRALRRCCRERAWSAVGAVAFADHHQL